MAFRTGRQFRKASNSRLATEWAPIENRFGGVRQNGILDNRFRGPMRDLGKFRTVGFGLVNLKLMAREVEGLVPDAYAGKAAEKLGPLGPHGRKSRQTFDYLRKE